MGKKFLIVAFSLILALALAACRKASPQNNEIASIDESSHGNSSYESVEGTQIRMSTENTEVIITLNDSRAAADLVAMLPLELTLIERNNFAKGMTLPKHLSSEEATTREYEIGDFGYWNAGPDLAIFYDDIYEQTIVEVIPLGHADSGAEALANEAGTVRLELLTDESEETENE